MAAKEQKLSLPKRRATAWEMRAANFVFQTMILFQLNFYTDTMGIAAAIAGSPAAGRAGFGMRSSIP